MRVSQRVTCSSQLVCCRWVRIIHNFGGINFSNFNSALSQIPMNSTDHSKSYATFHCLAHKDVPTFGFSPVTSRLSRISDSFSYWERTIVEIACNPLGKFNINMFFPKSWTWYGSADVEQNLHLKYSAFKHSNYIFNSHVDSYWLIQSAIFHYFNIEPYLTSRFKFTSEASSIFLFFLIRTTLTSNSITMRLSLTF